MRWTAAGCEGPALSPATSVPSIMKIPFYQVTLFRRPPDNRLFVPLIQSGSERGGSAVTDELTARCQSDVWRRNAPWKAARAELAGRKSEARRFPVTHADHVQINSNEHEWRAEIHLTGFETIPLLCLRFIPPWSVWWTWQSSGLIPALRPQREGMTRKIICLQCLSGFVAL